MALSSSGGREPADMANAKPCAVTQDGVAADDGASAASSQPASEPRSSCPYESSFGNFPADNESLSTMPDGYNNDRLTDCRYSGDRTPQPSKASCWHLPRLGSDGVVDAVVARLCSHVDCTLKAVVREALDERIAPVQHAVDELRALLQHPSLVDAGHRAQRHGPREPSSQTAGPDEEQLQATASSVARPVQRTATSSAHTVGKINVNSCLKLPIPDVRKTCDTDNTSELKGSFSSELSGTSVGRLKASAAEAGQQKNWLGTHRRLHKPNTAKVADFDSETSSSIVPAETSPQSKQQQLVGAHEHSLTATGSTGGRVSPRRECRQIFGDRGPDCNKGFGVQSLMLEVTDMILQQDGLMKVREGTDDHDSANSASSAPCHELEVHENGHVELPSVPQGLQGDGGDHIGVSGNPAETLHAAGPVDNGCFSDDGAGSTASPVSPSESILSPVTITQWRQSRTDALVHSVSVSAANLSRNRYLRSQQCLSAVMKAAGLFPWKCVEGKRQVWRHPVVWYQWFILLLVSLALVVCLQTLLAEVRETAEGLEPGSAFQRCGLAIDIPMTAGVLLGLVSLRTYSGSSDLQECQRILRSHADREKWIGRWIKHARRDLVWSVFVLLAAAVLRFVGEGFTLHSVACVFTSAMMISLTFLLVYFCRASANVVDQYCMQAIRAIPNDTCVFDWNVVQALLKKVSDALEKCIFVFHMAALVGIVFGVIDVGRGALSGPVQCASLASWALVMLDSARIMFCAAAVSDKCMRVPSLIITSTSKVDPKRYFIVQHISDARAGFYVSEILLDSALASKVAYMTCVVGVVVATEFSSHL